MIRQVLKFVALKKKINNKNSNNVKSLALVAIEEQKLQEIKDLFAHMFRFFYKVTPIVIKHF